MNIRRDIQRYNLMVNEYAVKRKKRFFYKMFGIVAYTSQNNNAKVANNP